MRTRLRDILTICAFALVAGLLVYAVIDPTGSGGGHCAHLMPC
jgi:hypothetical protein